MIAAAASVIVLWASSYVAVKVALEDVTPGQLALARYFVASMAFAVLARWRPPRIPPLRDLLRLAFAGGTGIALYNLALNTGQKTVGPGTASLLINTVPIWTVLLSSLVLREQIGARTALGTALAFAGASIIGFHQGGWSGFGIGPLWILAAALAQAIYFVLLKPLLRRYHPLDLTTWSIAFGCLLLLPFHDGLLTALRDSSRLGLGSIVYLGLGPAALAYLTWSFVLAELPASRAANLLFLIPVVTIAFEWLLLSDLPAPIVLLGGGLSVLGVLLGRDRERHRSARPRSPPKAAA